MKRTLKNILALVLIILCGCSMLLTMIQIQKGTSVLDWTAEHIESLLPSQTTSEDSQEAESAPDAADSSSDAEDETESTLPEPTAENPATAARVVEVFSMEEAPVVDPGQPAEPPEAGQAPDSGSEPPAKPEDVSADSTVSSLVLYEKKADGTLLILGMNWKDVLVFGIESLILCAVFWYLLMSVFNKKTFRQTFRSFDKFFIWLLCTLLSTAALTGFDVWASKTYFPPKTSSSLGSSGMMTPPDKPDGEPGTSGAAASDATYRAVTDINNDTALEYGEYDSSTADQNAIWVHGVSASLNGGTVEKTGSSQAGDATSFYGINSAILATDGAQLTLDDMTIETEANGANGVFAYGSNDGTPTKVIISNSSINTTDDQSGGIMTTGGASMQASDLTITTYGQSSAAIRTDRGGGTVDVTGGSYTTYGPGSPAIYSTADITVSGAELNANSSEGVIVEGHNSVSLSECTLSDANTVLNGQSTTYKNIFLYQSMSGDAEEGTAKFNAANSTISTSNGDTFYLTNTDAQITLSGNTIQNLDPLGSFMRLEGGPWGTEGKNGALAYTTLSGQEVTGDIHVDALSELYFFMDSGSYYEGAINAENTGRKVTVTLTRDCKIKMTGDWHVDSLTNEDKAWDNIDYNGYTLYVDGKGWNKDNS